MKRTLTALALAAAASGCTLGPHLYTAPHGFGEPAPKMMSDSSLFRVRLTHTQKNVKDIVIDSVWKYQDNGCSHVYQRLNGNIVKYDLKNNACGWKATATEYRR